jgi:hypothetical protein
VSAYVCYSTVLYLMAKYVSNYAEMPAHDLASQLILHLPNMPWFLGNLYLAVVGGAAVTAQFHAAAGRRP